MGKSEAPLPATAGGTASATPDPRPDAAPAVMVTPSPSMPSANEVTTSQLVVNSDGANVDTANVDAANVDLASPGAASGDEDDDDDQFQTVDTPSARSQSVDAISGIPAVVVSEPSRRNPNPGKSGSVRALSGSNPPVASAASGSFPSFPVANWDRYEFLSLLGQGGMGAVYKARDRRIRRTVALKFIRGGDERLTLRFMQEARAQSRVEHPGICKVLEVGEIEGKSYIAMQFVDGLSLQQARNDLSMLDKVAVIKEAAEALHAAHEEGVIHRDIKPANIMVERHSDGNFHPVIMDFGLARDTNESQGMTESGTVMGTAAYMSPEQARGNAKSLDRRTDVYSLGATLFDLLAGRPPFVADSMADTLLKVMLDEPPALSSFVDKLPNALDIIVGKCLNKEATQRYASARDFADDLGRFLSNRRIVGKRLSLYQRLRWRAQHNKPAFAVALVLFATVLFLIGYGISNRIQAIQKDRLARRQAELAQRLGQEIKDMEWMLRSARQLPLHNLEREKDIMRRRMARLQTELASSGELGRSLGYYALGRGHMALHEYDEALTQLRQAIAVGNQRPEVHYALGFVLGKHHEKALAEVRLAGGGEWAKGRIKELEPQFLLPAIESLQRSQSGNIDTVAYLEGLIAYYRGDYDRAIERATHAQREAPWLYEAAQLIGDVHMQRGYQLFDRGQTEPSEQEFAAAVQAFSEASQIGQSDAEIYEALSDAWRQRTAVAKDLQRPMDAPFAAAMAASDKIVITAPLSIAGPLKKAYAMQWRIQGPEPSEVLAVTAQQCVDQLERVFKSEPDHPYASSVWATCMTNVGNGAYKLGKDPTPYFQKAIARMEPVVQKHPYFFEGFQNLAYRYQDLASQYGRNGDPGLRQALEKALQYFAKALSIDPSNGGSVTYVMEVHSKLVTLAQSAAELKTELAGEEESVRGCRKALGDHVICDANRLIAYAAAAERAFRADANPQPYLAIVESAAALMRKNDVNASEVEQSLMLARFVGLSIRGRSEQSLAPALEELADAQKRCFAIEAKDPICHMLAAQAAWVESDALSDSPKVALKRLKEALGHAETASQSPLRIAAAWQVLAETQLRMAKLAKPRSKIAESALAATEAALARAFAINPNLATAHATQGSLQLTRAESLQGKLRTAAAVAAQKSFTAALASDRLLERELRARIAQAKEWSQGS